MILKQVAEGWYNWIRAAPELKGLIEERLAICDSCPHKLQLGPTGKAIATLINESSSTYKCGICKCPLSALTASPQSECGDGRWKAAGKK